MNTVEFIAIIFSVLCIGLASRNNVHTWWTSILASILFFITFYQVKLYADSILQLFYVVVSAYGWWNWEKGGEENSNLKITSIKQKYFWICFLASLVITLLYGFFLLKNTDDSYPFWDSSILVFSILAQIFLMQRILENWLLWIIIDAAAALLYYFKGLHLTAILYIWFCLNAVYGYIYWKKLKISFKNSK